MEHIVQFAIGIDDDAIKKRIAESAEKQIIENINHDVMRIIFKPEYYNSSKLSNQPTGYMDEKIDVFLEKHRDDIIELAAERLAERLSKTKRAKEIVESMKGI